MQDFGWFGNEFWDASWHLFASWPVLTYDIYIELLIKKKQVKRNLMSTVDIRDVLVGISEACSIIVYLYIWNLTWINIWRIEETTKYCEWNLEICYYCYYYLFIDAFWDPALRCDDFVCEFEFLLHWLFHTYSSHFVLMCFCVYIHILPLCCMPQLLIFLRCSPAFVILPVSILLVFMHLLSEPCLLLYTPHRQKTPWFSACPYSSGGDAPHAIP